MMYIDCAVSEPIGGELADMNISDLVHANRDEILRIAERRGASNVRVFGSVARGDADERSDLDLLVNMDDGRSLMDLCGFLIDVEELLGRKVDVVDEGGLSPYLRARILSEAKPL